MYTLIKNYFRDTYRYEELVVGLIILLPIFLSSPIRPSEIIAAAAVFFTFKHAAVADRLQERQAMKEAPDVVCYKKTNIYFMTKEALWVLFFIMVQSWAALTGAIIFFCYPLWRKWYRQRYPLGRKR